MMGTFLGVPIARITGFGGLLGDPLLPGRIYTGQRKPASPIKRFSAMWGLAPQAQTGMLRSYLYARQDYSKNNGGQSLLLEDRKDSPWTRIKRFQASQSFCQEPKP